MCVRKGIALVAVLGLVGVAGGQPAQPLDGDAIAAIWKERQDKVQTATFEFTRTEFHPRGSYSKFDPHMVRHSDGTWEIIPDKEPLPREDLRMSSKCRLLVDGVKVRHDNGAIVCDRDTGKFYVREEHYAFDGTHFRSTKGLRTKKGIRDIGDVREAAAYPHANMVAISTPLTIIRGRTKGLTMLDPRIITPTGRRSRIDGVECLEYLVGKMPDGSHARHVWLAPSQGWQVVRDIGYAPQTEAMNKKEIRYKPDPTVGWVPATWEYARIVKGELLLQSRFTLDSYTFNAPIDPGEFVLTFQKGMRVMDEDAKGGAVVGRVQDDGRILPEDGRPAYYLPGATEPVLRRGLRYGLYGLIAATAALILWRVTRRLRRPAATESPGPLNPQGGQP